MWWLWASRMCCCIFITYNTVQILYMCVYIYERILGPARNLTWVTEVKTFAFTQFLKSTLPHRNITTPASLWLEFPLFYFQLIFILHLKWVSERQHGTESHIFSKSDNLGLFTEVLRPLAFNIIKVVVFKTSILLLFDLSPLLFVFSCLVFY